MKTQLEFISILILEPHFQQIIKFIFNIKQSMCAFTLSGRGRAWRGEKGTQLCREGRAGISRPHLCTSAHQDPRGPPCGAQGRGSLLGLVWRSCTGPGAPAADHQADPSGLPAAPPRAGSAPRSRLLPRPEAPEVSAETGKSIALCPRRQTRQARGAS